MSLKWIRWRIASGTIFVVVGLPLIVGAAFLGWRFLLGIVGGLFFFAGVDWIAKVKLDEESSHST